MLFGGYRVVGGLLPPGGDGERVVSVPSGPFGTATGRNKVRIARLQFFFCRDENRIARKWKIPGFPKFFLPGYFFKRASQSFSCPDIFSNRLPKVFPARIFFQTGVPKFFLPGYFFKRASRSFSCPNIFPNGRPEVFPGPLRWR